MIFINRNNTANAALNARLTVWGGAFAFMGFAAVLLLATSSEAKVSATNTGSVVFGYDATCSSGNAGTLRYNSASPALQWCNGTAWANIGAVNAGSGTYGGTSPGVLVKLANGSALAPSLAFYNDPTTGIYFTTPHNLNFTINGTQAATFDGSGNFNLPADGFQIGGTTILTLPFGGTDTTGIAIGQSALVSQTGTGQYNIAGGYQAGQYISSGTNNIALGSNAMTGVTGTRLTGSYNIAFGDSALKVLQGAAVGNTALGAQAGFSLTTGTYNTALGYQALYSATTASYNTAIGVQAAYNTTGSYVTAAGYQALYTNTTGSNSTAIGYQALYNATTTNTALGYKAGYGITTGTGNTAIGNLVMSSGGALTGNYNTVVGDTALASMSGATSNNTAIGYYALSNVTTGANNTAFGYQAGYAGTPNTTGSNNTFIGYQARANAANYTNGTAIGNGAILTATNSIVLGNASISKLYCKQTAITGISDRRHKKDIIPLSSDMGLSFIQKLKPVSYRYNNGDETLRYGFIAQDLEQALPLAMQNMIENAAPEHGLAMVERQDNEERTYRAAYGELFAPIIKAIQEQQQQIETIRPAIDTERAQLADWRKMQADNENLLQTLKSGNTLLEKQISSRLNMPMKGYPQ